MLKVGFHVRPLTFWGTAHTAVCSQNIDGALICEDQSPRSFVSDVEKKKIAGIFTVFKGGLWKLYSDEDKRELQSVSQVPQWRLYLFPGVAKQLEATVYGWQYTDTPSVSKRSMASSSRYISGFSSRIAIMYWMTCSDGWELLCFSGCMETHIADNNVQETWPSLSGIFFRILWDLTDLSPALQCPLDNMEGND